MNIKSSDIFNCVMSYLIVLDKCNNFIEYIMSTDVGDKIRTSKDHDLSRAYTTWLEAKNSDNKLFLQQVSMYNASKRLLDKIVWNINLPYNDKDTALDIISEFRDI